MIQCAHWSNGNCKLQLYGGRPSPGVCLNCISKNENNAEFASALFAREKVSHPIEWRNTGTVSNCCGSATPGQSRNP